MWHNHHFSPGVGRGQGTLSAGFNGPPPPLQDPDFVGITHIYCATAVVWAPQLAKSIFIMYYHTIVLFKMFLFHDMNI
jgi:hypothetical protein